jgi:SpoVK/Ycf46/Vps4 family AAA+-type ATPase
MERREDYLKFQSGGKMTVPFEAFVVFSTNLKPEKLGDEAFLRRIQYKMLLRSPDEQEFTAIFKRFCESRNLACDAGMISRLIERLPFELTDDLLDRAFETCFLEEEGD